MTTHIMSLVDEMADDVVFLLDGQIRFRGGTENLKSEMGIESLDEAIAELVDREYA